MTNEKIKCGHCGKENWVDPLKTTSCKKLRPRDQGNEGKMIASDSNP